MFIIGHLRSHGMHTDSFISISISHKKSALRYDIILTEPCTRVWLEIDLNGLVRGKQDRSWSTLCCRMLCKVQLPLALRYPLLRDTLFYICDANVNIFRTLWLNSNIFLSDVGSVPVSACCITTSAIIFSHLELQGWLQKWQNILNLIFETAWTLSASFCMYSWYVART
jgi:hypothetical protein